MRYSIRHEIERRLRGRLSEKELEGSVVRKHESSLGYSEENKEGQANGKPHSLFVVLHMAYSPYDCTGPQEAEEVESCWDDDFFVCAPYPGAWDCSRSSEAQVSYQPASHSIIVTESPGFNGQRSGLVAHDARMRGLQLPVHGCRSPHAVPRDSLSQYQQIRAHLHPRVETDLKRKPNLIQAYDSGRVCLALICSLSRSLMTVSEVSPMPQFSSVFGQCV